MDIYKINFNNTNYILEFYQKFYQSLDLQIDFIPGNNVHAVWDILTGFLDGQSKFYFYGVNSLPQELHNFFYNDFLEIFDEAKQWYSQFNKEFLFTIVD